jgi:hypothetical protein
MPFATIPVCSPSPLPAVSCICAFWFHAKSHRRTPVGVALAARIDLNAEPAGPAVCRLARKPRSLTRLEDFGAIMRIVSAVSRDVQWAHLSGRSHDAPHGMRPTRLHRAHKRYVRDGKVSSPSQARKSAVRVMQRGEKPEAQGIAAVWGHDRETISP